jgi:hypothetical protein
MEGAPVSVTLIQPAAIDTPYPIHAKNFMEREAKHAPPAYAPETVARAILHSATTTERSVVVGGGGKAFIEMEQWTPRLLDKFMENAFVKQEKADYPPRPLNQNALDHPMGALEERGNYPGHTRESSYYTQAVTSKVPVLKMALAAGAGLALVSVLGRGKQTNGSSPTSAPAKSQPQAVPVVPAPTPVIETQFTYPASESTPSVH